MRYTLHALQVSNLIEGQTRAIVGGLTGAARGTAMCVVAGYVHLR